MDSAPQNVEIDSGRANEALAEVQEHYQTLLHGSCDGAWIIDAEGKIRFANRKIVAMLGYPAPEMQGRRVLDFFDKKWHSLASDAFERCALGISEKHDFQLQSKNGIPLWVTLATNPLREKGGRFLGSFAMVSDVNEHKLIEDSLRETKTELELHIQEKTAELENLNQILHQRETELNEAQRVAQVGKITEAALRQSEEALRENEAMFRNFFDSAGGMRGIVELVDGDILHISDNAVAAIYHGQTKESMQLKRDSELGVAPEITRVWTQRLIESKRTGAPVAFDYSNPMPGGDQWLFATVSYLGSSPEGRARFAYVTIDITLKREMEAEMQRAKRMESLATLTNGIARDLNNVMAPVLMIAPLLRDKVADAESRHLLDTLEANALRGAEIIRQLMVFGIGLPAVEGVEKVESVSAPDMPPHGHGELILLVEDEPAVREVLRETLVTFGYQVLTANDGSEALESYAIRQHDILAIVTDLAMPVMDGLALTRALKQMDLAVKIIVSTGLSQKSQRAALQELGVETFLDKPYMAGPLLLALQRVLSS